MISKDLEDMIEVILKKFPNNKNNKMAYQIVGPQSDTRGQKRIAKSLKFFEIAKITWLCR